jgi:hypothetical protein
MLILKKAAVIFCLLTVMLGANGISLQSHICSMAGQATQTIFPEIFGAKTSCCCSAESAVHVAGTAISKTPCCKSIFKYLKVPTYNQQTTGFDIPAKIAWMLPAVLFDLFVISNESKDVDCTQYGPPPPQLYGKFLLSFIHQLKFHLL